jgi:thiol-disulfide isomerase/thioredoxin
MGRKLSDLSRRRLALVAGTAMVLAACGSGEGEALDDLEVRVATTPAPLIEEGEVDGETLDPATATTAPSGAAPATDPEDASPSEGTSPASDTPAPVETQIGGAFLPEFDGTEPDPAFAMVAPTVVGTDILNGTGVNIAAEGRPLVVGFYAHWCPHCQREVAALTDWLLTEDLPDGVDFRAVSTFWSADRGNYPPEEWLTSEGWEHPVISDTEAFEIAEAFGVPSIPFYVFINSDGTVALRAGGNFEPAQLASAMGALLDRQP